MTIQRMDNVLIVVDDLEAAIAFFVELGMELEGKTQVEGSWVDRIVGLDGVRADIVMMRTPDGHGRVELTKFHTPSAISSEPQNAPANTLGIRRIMFAVDDIDDVHCPPAHSRRRTRRRGGAVRGQLPALFRPRPRGDHRRTGRAAQLTARRGRPATNQNDPPRPYDGTEQITPQCGKTPRWQRGTIVPRLVRRELVEAGIAWGSVE